MKKILLLATLLFMSAGSLAEETNHDQKEYIDNGVVRLGVDLSSGASVFYFAETDTRRNLLNHFDRGRFVQQSYYGDEDGSVWVWPKEPKEWRWNPVQGGDYKGAPAILLDFKSTATTLYSKSTPKHWASGEDITDAVMEQWISLNGPVAHIKYRFTYSGKHNHKARSQEMPAVFVDYALPNLVTYRGEKPWQNDALHRSVPGWPNEKYETTEHWSAYVDKQDWGIGLYTPGTSKNTSYRYKGDETAGPTGSATSYFSPIRKLAIRSGTVVEYDVYMAIGSVTDIRQRFYEIRSRPE